MKPNTKVEFGDFQTPSALAREVCTLLQRVGVEADAVLEPTCGQGAFLLAAAESFPRAKLHGWDVNENHVAEARAAMRAAGGQARASLHQQDFFAHDWDVELRSHHGRLLVLGNPPWVTNSAVAALNGSNLPAKENFLGLRGIAARTGKSNFDISEWMLIRLVRALHGRSATLAMLCKTATARKLLRYAWQNDGRIAEAALYRIDAKAHFSASVDACLLLAKTGNNGPHEADVFDSLSASRPGSRLGLAGQDLVANIHTYRRLQHLEGLCPYQWRSGVKHDCADVMELRRTENGTVENKLGERVALEPEYLFPLLKCSDLANGRLKPERVVLVTQRRVGEDTSSIASNAPRTWRYLQNHRQRFTERKSSIYAGRVPFALFGIGAYAFTEWKVAVSGLHRVPRFQVLGPLDEKPVFVDDTCYYLSFETKREATLVAEILNSEPCLRFLNALTFTDSKRPITVELLQRLNLSAIADEAGLGEKWRTNRQMNYGLPNTGAQVELLMETRAPARPPQARRRTPVRHKSGEDTV